MQRDERAQLLGDVRTRGLDNYRGIRVRATGKRFMINAARIRMLLDADGETEGKTATQSQTGRCLMPRASCCEVD